MKKAWYIYFESFWLFIFGSFIGFIHENLLHFLKTGVITARKGLIYGPFSQVYGIGALIYFLTLSKVKKPMEAFIKGALVGGVTEYICSLVQELIFSTISWDYSNYFLNFNGRTSIFHMFFWGLFGILFVKFIYPIHLSIIKVFKNKAGYIFTILFSLFMLYNISLSSLAGYRQDERRNKVEATSNIDKYLDEHYSDDVMNKIYPKSKVPKH